MKNPNVQIRLTDKHLWARMRAQAILESVPVSVLVERAFSAFLKSIKRKDATEAA